MKTNILISLKWYLLKSIIELSNNNKGYAFCSIDYLTKNVMKRFGKGHYEDRYAAARSYVYKARSSLAADKLIRDFSLNGSKKHAIFTKDNFDKIPAFLAERKKSEFWKEIKKKQPSQTIEFVNEFIEKEEKVGKNNFQKSLKKQQERTQILRSAYTDSPHLSTYLLSTYIRKEIIKEKSTSKPQVCEPPIISSFVNEKFEHKTKPTVEKEKALKKEISLKTQQRKEERKRERQQRQKVILEKKVLIDTLRREGKMKELEDLSGESLTDETKGELMKGFGSKWVKSYLCALAIRAKAFLNTHKKAWVLLKSLKEVTMSFVKEAIHLEEMKKKSKDKKDSSKSHSEVAKDKVKQDIFCYVDGLEGSKKKIATMSIYYGRSGVELSAIAFVGGALRSQGTYMVVDYGDSLCLETIKKNIDKAYEAAVYSKRMHLEYERKKAVRLAASATAMSASITDHTSRPQVYGGSSRYGA